MNRLIVCPVHYHGGTGCDRPHELYEARIETADGRQRAVFACAEHLPTEVEAALYGLRPEPPPQSEV